MQDFLDARLFKNATLADLYRAWAHQGQIPAKMSAVDDVANAMLSLVAVARANPSVVTDIVHLAPRASR